MTILIDGYNVLFAHRVLRPNEAGALERARSELLEFLVAKLTSTEVAQTVIVFDAKRLPRKDTEDHHEFRGVTILFARDHDEADDLLEELIRREPVPEKLVVVSGDRRVQQAARRRRARVVDSDAWLGELEQRPPTSSAASEPGVPEPRWGDVPLTPEQTRAWLEEFGIDPRQQKKNRHG